MEAPHGFHKAPLFCTWAPPGQHTGIRDAPKCLKCAPLSRTGAHMTPQAPYERQGRPSFALRRPYGHLKVPLFRIEAPLKARLFRPETPYGLKVASLLHMASQAPL